MRTRSWFGQGHGHAGNEERRGNKIRKVAGQGTPRTRNAGGNKIRKVAGQGTPRTRYVGENKIRGDVLRERGTVPQNLPCLPVGLPPWRGRSGTPGRLNSVPDGR